MRLTGLGLLAMASFVGCAPGIDCFGTLCEPGEHCVLYDTTSSVPPMCARPWGPTPPELSDLYTSANWWDGERWSEGQAYYHPYGTLIEGQACDGDPNACGPGRVCSVATGTCVFACQDQFDAPLEREWCPDGTACGYRLGCAPRCDAPGGPACPAGYECWAGECLRSGFGFLRPWAAGCSELCEAGTECWIDSCVTTEEALSRMVDCDGDGLPDCRDFQGCDGGYCMPRCLHQSCEGRPPPVFGG